MSLRGATTRINFRQRFEECFRNLRLLQFIEWVIEMNRADYHIFGLGLNEDNLHYVGWTRRSPVDEKEQIFTDLVMRSSDDVANWVAQALARGTVSIFEFESVESIEAACSVTDFFCRYFNSLGLDVVSDCLEHALMQVPANRPSTRVSIAHDSLEPAHVLQ